MTKEVSKLQERKVLAHFCYNYDKRGCRSVPLPHSGSGEYRGQKEPDNLQNLNVGHQEQTGYTTGCNKEKGHNVVSVSPMAGEGRWKEVTQQEERIAREKV